MSDTPQRTLSSTRALSKSAPWRFGSGFDEPAMEAHYRSRAIHTLSPAEQCGMSEWSFNLHQKLFSHLIDRTKSLVPVASANILDVGCNSGYLTAELANHFRHVVGVDYSRALVESALARGTKARFIQADARALPFEQGSFDLVTCFSMIHYLSDWRTIIDNIYRVTKPGGFIVLQFLQSRPIVEVIVRIMLGTLLRRRRVREVYGTLSRRISICPSHGYRWHSIDGRPLEQVLAHLTQTGLLVRELHLPRRYPLLSEDHVAVIAERSGDILNNLQKPLVCRSCLTAS
jgi:ubiquinone/menaquinone biosynthesis C-methylase UbiE